jgi:hypothetical protein
VFSVYEICDHKLWKAFTKPDAEVVTALQFSDAMTLKKGALLAGDEDSACSRKYFTFFSVLVLKKRSSVGQQGHCKA